MKNLDIILPCYNPLPGWAETIVQAMSETQSALQDVALHLYVVNDGSTKGIQPAQIAYLEKQIPNFKYVSYEKNRGKGYALREGFRHSKNEYCIYTDIDFPYTTESFVAVYRQLCETETEVASGLRDEHYYKNVPLARKRISKVFRFFLRYFFRLPVSDTQCGLKGFKSDGRAIFLQTTTNRYLFDLEFLFLAARQYPKGIQSVQVELKPGIVFSKMHINTLAKEGWGFLKIFFRSLFR